MYQYVKSQSFINVVMHIMSSKYSGLDNFILICYTDMEDQCNYNVFKNDVSSSSK